MPLAGIASGFAGLLFGLPCIRICGFYLIVSTLVAQYFVYWVIVTYPYFIDYATSSLVTLPPGQYQLFGLDLQSNVGKYLITLSVVAGLTLLAANLARGAVGRSWIAVRDMESVAGAMGVRVVRAKLSAFFVSSFYLGVTGVLYAYCYLGQVDPGIFDLRRSFLVLFMINIGGLGSITGSLLGAAFVYYLLRDEPSMGLAPQIVERVYEIITRLNTDDGVSFLVAEQSAMVAMKYCHYCYVIEDGQIKLSGTAAEEMANNKEIREVYLGTRQSGRVRFNETKFYHRRCTVFH